MLSGQGFAASPSPAASPAGIRSLRGTSGRTAGLCAGPSRTLGWTAGLTSGRIGHMGGMFASVWPRGSAPWLVHDPPGLVGAWKKAAPSRPAPASAQPTPQNQNLN